MKHYVVTVEGTAADGQTWKTTGNVAGDELTFIINAGMRDSFQQLTSGRAIFGNPGTTCRGPYDIHRVVIEQVKQ